MPTLITSLLFLAYLLASSWLYCGASVISTVFNGLSGKVLNPEVPVHTLQVGGSAALCAAHASRAKSHFAFTSANECHLAGDGFDPETDTLPVDDQKSFVYVFEGLVANSTTSPPTSASLVADTTTSPPTGPSLVADTTTSPPTGPSLVADTTTSLPTGPSLVADTTTSPPTGPMAVGDPCPTDDEYFIHSSDCGKYFWCQFSIITERSCPINRQFDVSQPGCVNHNNYDCPYE